MVGGIIAVVCCRSPDLQHRLDPGNIPKIGFEKLPKSFALKSLTLCTV